METEWSLVIVILFSPGRVFLCAFLVHATFPSFYRSWIYTENGTSSHLSLSLPLSFSLFPPPFFISPWIASEKIVERFHITTRLESSGRRNFLSRDSDKWNRVPSVASLRKFWKKFSFDRKKERKSSNQFDEFSLVLIIIEWMLKNKRGLVRFHLRASPLRSIVTDIF